MKLSKEIINNLTKCQCESYISHYNYIMNVLDSNAKKEFSKMYSDTLKQVKQVLAKH